MDTQKKLALRMELIWWVFTIIVLGGVLFPIVTKITHYPFLWTNVIFVVLFITMARYIFLLKHTFLAKKQWVKFTLLFLCIPLIFWLINSLNYFQTFLDEEGVESFMPLLSLEEQSSLGRYVRSEMIFFGVGSLVSAVIFPVRMLISFWRTRNRGTV